MELVADRFVVPSRGDVLDLATGEPVVFQTSAAGGRVECARWAARCDWFFRISHPAIARLVDYGLVGEFRRFEAWQCGPVWRGDRAEGERALGRARLFLQACGLAAPDSSRGAVRYCAGAPVLLPAADVGFEISGVSSSPAIDAVESCGISRITRPAFDRLAELFEEPRLRRGRVISVWGEAGAGIATLVRDVARMARSGGFVPIACGRTRLPAFEMVRGRSLLVICNGGPRDAWLDVLRVKLEAPQPHVVLFVGRSDVGQADGIHLAHVETEQLVRAVRPLDLDKAIRRRVEALADRSGGVPGRFAQLMWAQARYDSDRRPHRRSVAAERSVAYGEETAPATGLQATTSPVVSALPADLKALLRRLDAGMDHLQRGHHAAGDRLLRHAIGGLARRRDGPHAVQGALALSSALLRRGRAREACGVLDSVKPLVHQGADASVLIDVAVLSGVAAMDLGRPDEAEVILRGACAAARAAEDPKRVVASGLALARCLFWCGEYDGAGHVLSGVGGCEVGGELVVRVAMLESRLALSRHDVPTGVSRARDGVEAAERLDDRALTACAHGGLALAHLAAGDREAVERDVSAAVSAARSAREPLRALKARLTGAEALRRAGRHACAARLIRRLGRIPASNLPATVRARANLLRECLQKSEPGEFMQRQIAATGLKALALFAPGSHVGGPQVWQRAAEDLSDILRACQEADDETSVPAEICARVRTRLGATGVALFARGRPLPLASAGGSVQADVAARVFEVGGPLVPCVREGRVEGGAPIRYGGETIGVIVGRWPLGTSNDFDRASAVMNVAASVAGPALAAALAHSIDEDRRPASDLLGVSSTIADVRRAIDRSAAAPFAVLIQGESGCGKELVARALHRRSPRSHRAFCALNCAALPDDLIETELFGHARGAFTGAAVERSGVFEEASGGTLFLDEIGELSPRAQAKVLRAIQEGEIRRVGENCSRRIDVRIVAATNRDLRDGVIAGRFRADLLYRLDVIRIPVPPLRERREDIAILAERFWRDLATRVSSRAVLAASTLAALAQYDWPGNVRELQNVLAALAVRAQKRGVVLPTALPPQFKPPHPETTTQLEEARRTFEEQFVRAALVRTGGRRGQAAEELGLTRQGLAKLMTRLGID